MSMTLTAAAPTRTNVGSDLDHLYCCDPDLALCGLDISDYEELAQFPDDDLCVVCREMECLPCGVCGG